MAYDEKFKIKVVEFCLRGNTFDEAVDDFGVGKGSVSDWMKQYKATKSIPKKTQNREHLRIITPKKIDAFLLENPSADQQEMAAEFGCTNQSVSDALRKFGYSKKKLTGYTKNLIP